MTEHNSHSLVFFTNESVSDEHLRLKMTLKEFEDEAIKKDQLLSQLMSRVREYEMGEYGLSEAVNEIKECKKVIRARDREIEKLTDEINTLKLHISCDLKNKINAEDHENKLLIPCGASIIPKEENQIFEEKIKKEDGSKSSGKHQSSQCYIPIYSSKYDENIYLSKLQNELLRSELIEVCKKTMECMSCLQKDNEKHRIKSENVIKKFKDNLKKQETRSTVDDDDLGNNNLSTGNEHKSSDNMNECENIAYSFDPMDVQLILQIAQTWKICSDVSCNNTMIKLMELELKLLNEVSFLRKLLEISHHQTQKLETINFSQDVQIKALKNYINLFQGKNDEKNFLSKLAMKVLQLQFNQASHLFESKTTKADT